MLFITQDIRYFVGISEYPLKSSPKIYAWYLAGTTISVPEMAIEDFLLYKQNMISHKVFPQKNNPFFSLPLMSGRCTIISTKPDFPLIFPQQKPSSIIPCFLAMSGAAGGWLWGAAAYLQCPEPHRPVAEAGLLLRPPRGRVRFCRLSEALGARVAAEGARCLGKWGGVDAGLSWMGISFGEKQLEIEDVLSWWVLIPYEGWWF